MGFALGGNFLLGGRFWAGNFAWGLSLQVVPGCLESQKIFLGTTVSIQSLGEGVFRNLFAQGRRF